MEPNDILRKLIRAIETSNASVIDGSGKRNNYGAVTWGGHRLEISIDTHAIDSPEGWIPVQARYTETGSVCAKIQSGFIIGDDLRLGGRLYGFGYGIHLSELISAF